MNGFWKKRSARPEASGRLFEPPAWQWARSGDVGWWVRDGWEAVLLGPEGLRLDEWRREDRVTVVKSGPHRVVYRVDLPKGAVFVKHFLVPNLRAKLRQWVRKGKGRNEALRTLDLDAIGVATITPVALGEQRKRQVLYENYLITHAIPEAVPLDEFLERRLPEWPEQRQAKARRDLAKALALLTARLHDAGIQHQDFHPGNVLVRMDAEGPPRLAMIDLDALRVTRPIRRFVADCARMAGFDLDPRRATKPLNWSRAQRNLALLNHYFWLRCGRVERYRFLSVYLKARQAPRPPETGGFARAIEDATRAWAERLWRRWGRRCRSTNKYFVAGRGRKTWSVASRALDDAALRALRTDPDAPFRHDETVVLKQSRTTTVAETTMPVAGRPTRVIYKRFNRKAWFEPFLTLFRPSKAWQSWHAAQDLVSRAVPTPKNLAYIARYAPFGRDLFWWLPQTTYLITVKEENAVTLGDYVRTVLPALGPEARRARVRRLSWSLARLLRTLHERSLSDRDLKAANILVIGDPATDAPRLSLIDLVGVRLLHPLPRDRRVQNLARLHLSLAEVPGRTRTDALRFLRAYLPRGLSPLDDWKGLWRDVAARGRTKRARNQRLGRVLS